MSQMMIKSKPPRDSKMANTRRELLDRWRGIEEEDDDVTASNDPAKQRRFRQLKEDWFSDAFNYLIYLPQDNHIWCGFWDLMGPLLETFYNYFKDERHDSPLKLLWKRLSEEMQQCTQCICQHHQAQEMYNTEYESICIGPLLDVLQNLDEDRVTRHLKEINSKIARGQYNPQHDNSQVVSVMFEVFMFPILLDDQSLVLEFQNFIEGVDDCHELTLAGHQQYSGVYALLFFKSRRVRSIGFRLAGHVGKLRYCFSIRRGNQASRARRVFDGADFVGFHGDISSRTSFFSLRAAELEPLQPLLKRCIGFLEMEVVPAATETLRPRMQLDRITVWLGIKALLGFLEPPAFEEGILERYPVFLSIVLNHISDDSLEFSHAVNCLRLLFEMLGCKLWLRATLSPSVMRNTLLGQCFHTRNEKSHKEIFDLFQPFLQSLEALQDGEHEKQRRHFLYFLLHQVTVSSNFSILMRKKACQIALCIIHRGYKMNPPCPPFECAHMWGPSLVSSLKDSSLHSSLRQPALDLIQTIIVSDTAALVSTVLNCHMPPHSGRSMCIQFNDEDEDEGLRFAHDVKAMDTSWDEFSAQGKIASREYHFWMCMPMLWLDVLVEIDTSVLPNTFSKAVLWSLSRISIVEAQNSIEMGLPIRNWLTTCAADISHLLGWKLSSGSDDVGDGKKPKNSVKVTTICTPLIRVLKRLAVHFVVRVDQGELRKQWTWEPRMGESLILLLVDPDDNARQVGRRILEQVSNTRGLVSGLQFLCSCSSSLSAVFSGLRHALKLVNLLGVKRIGSRMLVALLCKKSAGLELDSFCMQKVQLDSVLLKFQTLHHLFFVLCKLLKEGNASSQTLAGNTSEKISTLKFSSQGGFLQQPVFDSLPNRIDGHSLNVDYTSWVNFSCFISEIAWSSMRRCLAEGKAFIDCKVSQMTCIRLLEILPVVFERVGQSIDKVSRNWFLDVENDFKWLLDLMDWGKSSLVVVVRYWKQTVVALLGQLKGACKERSALTISTIEKLVSCDTIAVDELTKQVSGLSVSLMSELSCTPEKPNSRSEPLSSEDILLKRVCSGKGKKTFSSEDDMQILDSATLVSKEEDPGSVIVLSDDEKESKVSACDVIRSYPGSSQVMSYGKTRSAGAAKTASQGNKVKKNEPEIDSTANMLEPASFVSQKLDSDKVGGKQELAPLVNSKVGVGLRKEVNSKCTSNDIPPQKVSKLKKSDGTLSSNIVDSFQSPQASDLRNSSGKILSSKSIGEQGSNKASETRDIIIKELVRDAEDDPWELGLKSARRQDSSATKTNTCGPKRQVIPLNLPVKNRFVNSHRLDGRKRFKAPSLDDWFRPILEIDYFVTVGLASASEEENQSTGILKEVPVCFQSPNEYMTIFQPLVLEEFKAQLRSSVLEMDSSEEMFCGSLSVLSVERIDDFHVVRCVHDDTNLSGSRSFYENDLILLTRQPLQNSSHDVHLVGKVERREKDNKKRLNILVIRFYLQNGSSRLNRARKLLLDRSKWYIRRLMSITPQLREFQALSSIKDIPLLPIILNPINFPLGNHEPRKNFIKLSQSLQKTLNSSFNDIQLQAISASLGPLDLGKDFDLTLIQGPPGTGKTRTIIAIVSGLLALSQANDTKRPFNGGLSPSNTLYASAKRQMSQSAAVARAWQDAALARQLNKDEETNSKSVGGSRKGRVLICAQSNAAVDELVSRISREGLYGSDGVMYKPFLVRVGNAKTVHPNSLPFFIDTLVEQRLAEERMHTGEANDDASGETTTALRSSLEKLVENIRFYEAKRANLRDDNSKPLLDPDAPEEDDTGDMSDTEIGAKLRKLYQEKKAVYINLSTAQAREKKAYEESRALKHNLRKSILREAEIVVATLSGCGGDLYGVCSESVSSHKFSNLSESTLFDAVVIDEAAQALEPATLIPLQLLKSRGAKCIMVGDPKQLPATVLSNIASKYLYQCSMFERLQRAGHPVIMLTKQYRMHPEISHFPSLHFYNSQLLNGDEMSSKAAPFHKTESLGPYLFFDIIDGQEVNGKNSSALSLYNECEADAAVEILRFFRKSYPSEFIGGRIGIITPYKCQLSLLRSRVSSAFGSSVMTEIELNTVDGFQGREVDILLLSTVRAAKPCSASSRNSSSNIGFVADVRRMNVSLTRAKHSLWILGNARTLQTNDNWSALIRDAEERNLIVSTKRPYDSIFKSIVEKDSASGYSHIHSRKLKHTKKVREVSRDAEQRHKYANIGNDRKRKFLGGGADCGNLYSASKDTDKISKFRASNGREFTAKKGRGLVVVESSVKRTVKDAKTTVTENRVRDDEVRVKSSSEKQSSMGNIDSVDGKGCDNLSNSLDPSKRVINGSPKILELEHTRKKGIVDGNKPLDEGSLLMGDEGNDGAGVLNQIEAPKAAIRKRKQQREAVEALLSSALISSKKPEISSKSVPAKRPHSPKRTAGHAIKCTKPRKVLPASSSGMMDAQSHHHLRKRDKPLGSQGVG